MSITYWSRIEPRPRAEDLNSSLAARVRDPAWMLARQWQVGEFRGEDAGSPAYVEITNASSALDAWWRPNGDEPERRPVAGPLDVPVTGEPFTPDLSVRVELGQVFRELLVRAGHAELAEPLAALFPVDDDAAAWDPDAARFLALCRGALDGYALYVALGSPQGVQGVPDGVRDAYLEWVRAVYGELGEHDGPAWDAARLEYRSAVSSAHGATFEAQPGVRGELDWSAFGLIREPEAPAAEHVDERKHVLVPSHVTFPGMPNKRWWHFEEGRADFARVDLDKTEVGTLKLVDFLVRFSADWFLVPLEQDPGTVNWITALAVVDVFGERFERQSVERSPGKWSLFTLGADAISPPLETWGSAFRVQPADASALAQSGDPIERVRFLRDDAGNLVWAVEEIVESGTGEPLPGYERTLLRDDAKEAAPNRAHPELLLYRAQLLAPAHWIPFVFSVVDAERREVDLIRSAQSVLGPGGGPRPLLPAGRILRPTLPAGETAYRIGEEEVTTVGLEVTRQVRRARWSDGSTRVWIVRRSRPGPGPEESRIAFDRLIEPEPPRPVPE